MNIYTIFIRLAVQFPALPLPVFSCAAIATLGGVCAFVLFFSFLLHVGFFVCLARREISVSSESVALSCVPAGVFFFRLFRRIRECSGIFPVRDFYSAFITYLRAEKLWSLHTHTHGENRRRKKSRAEVKSSLFVFPVFRYFFTLYLHYFFSACAVCFFPYGLCVCFRRAFVTFSSLRRRFSSSFVCGCARGILKFNNAPPAEKSALIHLHTCG